MLFGRRYRQPQARFCNQNLDLLSPKLLQLPGQHVALIDAMTLGSGQFINSRSQTSVNDKAVCPLATDKKPDTIALLESPARTNFCLPKLEEL
jgi:hypothetical protein